MADLFREAQAAALRPLVPDLVLPTLRPADLIASAGQWLGVACPIPSPEEAPLVVLQAPMGCGKTRAIEDALKPLQLEGVPILLTSHRKALGQALAERVGIPWRALPGTDKRLQGVAACFDSWCPTSQLRITGDTGREGVLVLDEWMQQVEHLLIGTGTALTDRTAPRRAAVLRTLAEQLLTARLVIAADAQMAEWGVALLEALTGRRAVLIRSDHQPMAGRPLHCPAGFTTPQKAAEAFRRKWAELVADGAPFLSWTSAQKAGSRNAPQTLAALHRQRVPGARVAVIDCSTPEAAAELAADPDGFAARFDAIYCSPSISSGVSFASWRPAAMIALAGGHIAAEHVAQAAARIRCPEVPAYLFAPEVCPGAAMRVGSGSTNPAELIRHMRSVADRLLGVLEEGDAEGAWLQTWAELGAHRNRQRFAYRAMIAGLLEREGWSLQEPGTEPCPAAGAQAAAALQALATAAQAAADQALINAPAITDQEADALARRRRLPEGERLALDRHSLAQRWGLGDAAPSLPLLNAERDGLRKQLRLNWLLTCPEARALIPAHDAAAIAALDPAGRPFAPDRLRVALAARVKALEALGVPQLLERFAAGQWIAATDSALLQLQALATAHAATMRAVLGVGPGKRASGTLRALARLLCYRLEARRHRCGHRQQSWAYRAQRMALPEGVSWDALTAVFFRELQPPDGAVSDLEVRQP